MEHRIEAKVGPDRVIVLENLPFPEGDAVDIIIVPHQDVEHAKKEYPLRGKPIRYDQPLMPVAEDEWNLPS